MSSQATAINLHTCWIDRRAGKDGAGATPESDGVAGYDFRFETLADLAKAHMDEETSVIVIKGSEVYKLRYN